MITIDNASSTESVPTTIINKRLGIEKVLDRGNYQIKLYRYYELLSDVTNGGEAVSIKYLIKFRLLFNQIGTIGQALGFIYEGKRN